MPPQPETNKGPGHNWVQPARRGINRHPGLGGNGSWIIIGNQIQTVPGGGQIELGPPDQESLHQVCLSITAQSAQPN